MRYLTFQGVSLSAAALSLLVLRFLPEFLGPRSPTSIVLIILSAHYGLLAFYALAIYPLVLNPLRHLKGPKTAVGLVVRSMLKKDTDAGKALLDLMDQYPDDDLLLIDMFRSQVMIAKPHLLADLLVQRPYDFVKPPRSAGFLKQFLGNGLVIVEGDQHKFLRKNTLPAFSFRHIKDLYPMMWEKSTRFTKRLESEIQDPHNQEPSTVIDLNIWASKVTLDIIGVAGLGREFNTIHNSDDPLAMAYEELTQPRLDKSIYFALSGLLGMRLTQLLPWKLNKVFARIKSTLSSSCKRMIQEKRDAIKGGSDDHFDILSLLIKSNNFSDDDLRDQLLTFLAAGHETTSSSLSWVAYLLSKHPDMQAKVREEVQRELSNRPSGEPLDIASALEGLPYLNGVINETLRIFPTVPLTLRKAICDTTLGNYKIPEGTNILVSPWAINRSPLIWGPDSAEFRPERWITPENKPNQTGGAISNYQFLTFLHGPRSCIGQGFARAELRCLLATMVTSFEWELAMPDEQVIPRGAVTIKPANGMFIKLKSLESGRT